MVPNSLSAIVDGTKNNRNGAVNMCQRQRPDLVQNCLNFQANVMSVRQRFNSVTKCAY